MNEWKISDGHVVLFSLPGTLGARLSALEYFKQVWGAEPEQFQKSTNPMMPSVAQARRNGIVIGCSMHQTRVDFNLTALAPSLSFAPSNILQIQDAKIFNSEMEQILQAINGASGWGDFNRIALNVHIQNQQSNISEANKSLSEAIPEKYRLGITDEEDFILQINRPYMSTKVNGVRVNTITKWSVDRFRILQLNFGPGNTVGPQGSNQVPMSKDLDVASISIDVNSLPTEKELPPTKQAELLREAQGVAMTQVYERSLQIRGL